MPTQNWSNELGYDCNCHLYESCEFFSSVVVLWQFSSEQHTLKIQHLRIDTKIETMNGEREKKKQKKMAEGKGQIDIFNPFMLFSCFFRCVKRQTLVS